MVGDMEHQITPEPPIRALFPLIMTDRLRDLVDFYRSLLGLQVVADVGWYVQMVMPVRPWMQLAVIEHGHESVPVSHHAAPAGVAITVEVDDVDAVHAIADAMGVAIHVSLRDEEWGQRHFITEDPAGLLVDVVTPIAPSPAFLSAHGLTGGEPRD